jgi:peptidoglycan/xylan/chitin deacetylase (PgdA/CDA1 family)
MAALRSQLGFLRRRFLSSVYPRHAQLNGHGPVVSFCFDDFPRSALTIGGRILRNAGAQGTYYAAMGLMNTSNELGEHFDRNDLNALINDGHELASHTFSHISCRSVGSSDFRKDVEKGQQAIAQLTGQTGLCNFAFPYGVVTLNAKKAIGKEMTSCRGIWPGLNGPQVDLNLLCANSLYGGSERNDMVRRLIEDNLQRRTWLIFYSHDVQQRPSRFGCTPALLEFAVSCATRSGARILTVAQVMTELVGSPKAQSC